MEEGGGTTLGEDATRIAVEISIISSYDDGKGLFCLKRRTNINSSARQGREKRTH